MRTIRLYDTARGALAELVPRDPGRVGIYACGPTVYARIHVGNARPYVVFSLLKRFLEHEGYATTLVANITDVNDKIYDAARRLDRPSAELAAEMTAHYKADTEALGLGRPDAEPLASESVSGIISLVEVLLARDAAYVVDGDVYFRVRADPRYGSISGRDIEEMDQGEGLEGADRKQDPLDFALWKAQKAGEDTAWTTPWGVPGRPGWHIECSAMAEELLGVGFDVHGGGIDLAFPHHENEAAQTRCARDGELANIWMHNGMLQLGEKMSKSLGNVVGLPEALAAHGRDTLIALLVGGHYRQPLQYGEEALRGAAGRVRGIREAGRRLVDGPSPAWSGALRERCFAALAEDFNTPIALAAVAEWVSEANRSAEPVGRADLAEMLHVLGLQGLLESDVEGAPADVLALADARQAAREARDWAEADRLRDAIAAAGWTVRDAAGGPELVPA